MRYLMFLAALLVMAGVVYLLVRITRKPEPAPPIIQTAYGPVTEWARKQAVSNMLTDPDLRGRVYQIVLRECGGDEGKAVAEFDRRYPELRDAPQA